MNLTKTREYIDELKADQKSVKNKIVEESNNLKEAEIYLTQMEEAQKIVQHVAQEIQQQAHDRITKVVTSCLQTVFDGEDDYGFRIRFERKRGKTEAVLVITKNGHEVDDILEGDSGGVVDVAAFALRVSNIMLSKPRLRKFVALDEPFKFVSRRFRPNVRSMIDGLAKDFGFQFIMVTHISELETGKVIEL
jgi:DNA repair exonuclease SbcCD ATPase subunit